MGPLLGEAGQIPLLIGWRLQRGWWELLRLCRRQWVQQRRRFTSFTWMAILTTLLPEAKRCNSAASCAVWLLTHDSPFWAGPVLSVSQVSVVGWSNPSRWGRSGD